MLVIRVLLFALSLWVNLATISRTESSESARNRGRWAEIRGWMLLVGAALCTALVAMLSASADASVALEERKLPMKFSWVACQPNCRGWVSAVGIVTADSPRDFDEFARGRQLGGATIVLDSSGGSVNDAIALGRRFRELGALTTVGISAPTNTVQSAPANMAPVAYCESMCVFLLLSGTERYVPDTAHVRVHQIWLGDRANDAKAATYSADDLMIVERDIGRLAKYTFDMGGAGDLLSMSLNVPPWEDLHELSREELRLTNLVTTDMIAQPDSANAAVVELTPKSVQGHFVSSAVATDTNPEAARSTKSVEAMGPTGGVRGAAQPKQSSGRAIGAVGAEASQGPDFEGQIRQLRSSDTVYFTKAGARKLAHCAEPEIVRLLTARSIPIARPTEPATPDTTAIPGQPAPRPLVGTIVPLEAPSVVTDQLLGGPGSPPGAVDAGAARTLTKGEALTPPPGRADDFAWPSREVGGEQAKAMNPVASASPDAFQAASALMTPAPSPKSKKLPR
jgi:hypothetical protein